MDWFTRRHARGRPPHPDVLTPAEWRVLEEVRAGRSNAEIAERLDVSVNTVRRHVSSMLAKLDLPDRHALAQWDGEPAVASTRRMGRLALVVGASAGVVALAAVFWVALDGARGTSGDTPVEETPTPTPTAAAVATEVVATEAVTTPMASPTGTPSVSATPYRVTFAAGEPIDVWPAVVFIEPDTGDVEAWVFPLDAFGEFGVSPGGGFIVWRQPTGTYGLLNTETGRVHQAGMPSLPIEYGPGDTGYVARHDGIVSAFGPDGTPLNIIGWRAAEGPVVAAWSPDGKTIAIGQNKTGTAVSFGIGRAGEPAIAVPSRAADGSVANFEVPENSQVSLRWSHDGSRLAFLVRDHLRVYASDGTLLWEQRGSFEWNPRWSPDDRYLYVSGVGFGETAHLFTADGEPVLRFHTGYAGGCGGEVWLNDSTFGYGAFDVSVDGQFSEAERPHALYADLGKLGIVLAPSVDGFHHVHYGLDEGRPRLDDGRYVISTPGIGHDGCAVGVSAGPDFPTSVEFPPYDD